MHIIETVGLTKHYGKVTGVQGLSLIVGEGEIFGFLGPNGAGKTTFIHLLLDILRPERGRARVFGLDCHRDSREIRRRIGYIPGEIAFYDELSGREYLELMASFRSGGARRLRELQSRFGLDLRKKIRTYSRGMKQKLAIIQAFMHDPELLILDEPTTGLDPLMQREFEELLGTERGRGKTIFLSSHLLSEVERLCERVGIIRAGELVEVATLAELKRQRVRRMHITFTREITLGESCLGGARVLKTQGCELVLEVQGEVPILLHALSALPVADLSFPEATLEDTFLEHCGEQS